jgi:hypothetical protein
MVLIYWPSIFANSRIIAALLDDLLRAFVVMSAKRLQLAEYERIDIAFVRLNVVANLSRGYLSFA